MLVRELARRLDAAVEGDGEREIVAAAPLEQARESHLTFVGSRKAAEQAVGSVAGCLLVPMEYSATGQTVIRVANPRAAFAQALHWLHPRPVPVTGVHPTAVVDASAVVPASASVGAHCVVGANVVIGEGSVLHPRVTLYDGVTIGRRVMIHSGAVLGADGFGFVPTAARTWEKFPQVGGVVIGDDVEIGANCCIDRGALGDTVIGDGTKLDNLVHVAHNCRIGQHVVVAAQTGFSGGVTIGDHAIVGGQVGVGDKARIESGAVVGSGAGILPSKIVKAGTPMWGTPARPLREHLEQLALIARLPEMRKEIAELRRLLEQK
jgi:UDP-3-O-[3-hydroxymyristoyl] glucosamine N-acyltransferase